MTLLMQIVFYLPLIWIVFTDITNFSNFVDFTNFANFANFANFEYFGLKTLIYTTLVIIFTSVACCIDLVLGRFYTTIIITLIYAIIKSYQYYCIYNDSIDKYPSSEILTESTLTADEIESLIDGYKNDGLLTELVLRSIYDTYKEIIQSSHLNEKIKAEALICRQTSAAQFRQLNKSFTKLPLSKTSIEWHDPI